MYQPEPLIEGAGGQPAEDYWNSLMARELPALNFPKARGSQVTNAWRSGLVRYSAPEGFMEKLASFCLEQDIMLLTLLSGGVNALLSRYTQQDEFFIEVETRCMALPGTVGEAGNSMFVSTLLDKEDSVKQLLRNQQSALLEAYEYSLNGEDLLERLKATPGNEALAMPEIFIGLQEEAPAPPESAGGNVQNPGIRLLFSAGDELRLSIEYNAQVYSSSLMERMPVHLQAILSGMMAADGSLVRELDYLTDDEISELHSFNALKVACPPGKTLIDLFDEQALRSPGRAAAVFEGRTITYAQLKAQAERLAAYLAGQGVQPKSCVLLCFNHHMDFSLAGLLGILKAGCAYVPLDSDLPQERVAYVIKDTKAQFVITNSLDAPAFASQSIGIINLDGFGDADPAPGQGLPQALPGDLAYVIYTSGTTGEPKGVMISHGNLMDYYMGLNERIGFDTNRTSALMSTLSTDLGNTVVYGTLASGNTLHLFSKETLRQVEYLHHYFEDHEIDCIKVVPTYWNALEYGSRFVLPRKMVIFGGEQLSTGIVNKIRSQDPAVRIINHYGPTETTIGKLMYEVTAPLQGNTVPVGRPFSNTRIYIVDRNLSLCAKGVWGELLIGGEGVFSGYLENRGQTEKRLVRDARFADEPLYRTGDLVRINEHDEIEFGSRTDDQVKIQGYRIEPAGIEAIARQYPHVRDCFIHPVDHTGSGTMLVAYLYVTPEYTEPAFRTFLAENLPAYMIPSVIITVPEFPLKSNGKVDKKKLFATGVVKDAEKYEAPQNEVQALLVAILEDIFSGKRIGINDNFYELGGDSIKSIQMASRLRQRGYKLLLKDIVKHPVIRDLATFVKATAAPAAQDGPSAGMIPLSPIQKLFFEQKTGNYNHYNQAVTLRGTNMAEDVLKSALTELARFHDTLRIRFRKKEGGEWEQYYEEKQAPFEFESVPYTGEDALRQKTAGLGTSFDIEKGPMMRVCLFRSDSLDVLYIVVHHLLIDGVSFRILVEDLTGLYYKHLQQPGFRLQQKTTSLKEWQTKLVEYAGKEQLLSELDYWRSIDKAPFDSMKPFAPQVSNTIAERKRLKSELDENATADLLTRCYRRYGTETLELLLTAVYQGIHQVFGVNRLLLNLEGHGREYIGYDLDVSRTLGWFTTIYPALLELQQEPDGLGRLLRVKQYLEEIPVKGLGYGVLRYLAKKDLQAKPEITFNYLGDFSLGQANTPGPQVFRDVRFDYQDASELTACSDLLTITCILEGGKLSMYFNFNSLVFTGSEIEALSVACRDHLLELMAQVVS